MREELTAARHLTYALLSRVFIDEPDDVLLHALDDGLFRESYLFIITCVVNSDSGDVPATTSRISSLCASQDSHDALEALSAMEEHWLTLSPELFNRLFIGPGGNLVFPWESAYRGTSSSLFQSNTLDVRAAYERGGFHVRGLHRVADDYLGTELDFMAKMCRKELDWLEKGEPAKADETAAIRYEFLSSHLLTWVDEFSTALDKISDAAGYADSAHVLCELVHADSNIGVDYDRR